MLQPIKISLRLPAARDHNLHYSIRLQHGLQVPPCRYPSARRVLVMPGIKGAFRAFCSLLLKHRIITRHLQWNFGDGHLVIFGHQYAPGEPDTESLWFLYSLEQKARSMGGAVHFIPGTHEIRHINGAWRFTHPSYPSATVTMREPFTALYHGNAELRHWLGSRNFVEQIGQYVFLHADLLPLLQTKQLPFQEINDSVRSFCSHLLETDAESALFFERPVTVTTETINALLEKLGAERLIIGNSLLPCITTDLDGKLIHTGIDYTSENPAALLIKRRKLLCADRKGRIAPLTL